MNTVAEQGASHLLQIKAIKLEPNHPFTWASGWKSPIYCDNRKTLSYPEVRTYIRDQFVNLIKTKYPQVELIAGVATGAIAQGALVAQELGLPFVYVRSAAKNHGLENLIGGSSLQAVEALRNAGCDVLGMVAIFTYGFQKAIDNFTNAHCVLDTLSDYNAMIDLAQKTGYVQESDVAKLKEWRLSPESYK